MDHHYATLGVYKGADKEELDRARRRLAFAHHPDHGGTGMGEVNVAYDTLLNEPEKYLASFGRLAPCSPCRGEGYRRKVLKGGEVGKVQCSACKGIGGFKK